MATKQYEVEVKSPRHGRYGCTTYFGLVLSCGSMKAAKDFAWEIVSEMTRREFNERSVTGYKAFDFCLDEKVGEDASIYFYTARPFAG